MSREKFAWFVSVVLLGLMAFQLPDTLAQRDDDYTFVRTLIDIHRQVINNYADDVDEQKLRDGAIQGMLEQLDPYSMYVPENRREEFERMLEGSFRGVGIQLNQLDNGQIEVITPIDNSPAFKAGIMAGDIILKVNDQSVEGMRLQEVVKLIAGPIGTEVSLTVRHLTGEEQTLTMTREEVVIPTLKGYGRTEDQQWDWFIMDDPKIAYLRLTQFTPDSAARVSQVLRDLLAQGMRGLILDLRFNPGGRLDQAVAMVDMFVDEGVIVSTRGNNRPERVEHASARSTLPKFPMIVLVNEHSASASEIVAGSLKDHGRAVVMGTRTYGKGSVQEVIPLDGRNGELKLTVAYYYLPSGRLVHRKKDAEEWGVEPHIAIPVDPEVQQQILRERAEAEQFRRPVPRATTRSSTRPTTEQAESVDVQLQRAVDTMIGMIIHEGNIEAPATMPTTVPATQEVAGGAR